jgi:hypothetical protein
MQARSVREEGMDLFQKKTKRNKSISDLRISDFQFGRGLVFKVLDILIIEERFFNSSDFGKIVQKLVLFGRGWPSPQPLSRRRASGFFDHYRGLILLIKRFRKFNAKFNTFLSGQGSRKCDLGASETVVTFFSLTDYTDYTDKE